MSLTIKQCLIEIRDSKKYTAHARICYVGEGVYTWSVIDDKTFNVLDAGSHAGWPETAAAFAKVVLDLDCMKH